MSDQNNISLAAKAANIIDIIDLTKNFDDHIVLDGINLSIKKNEFITLLGPSGCGKTTLLRILAGFEQITDGRILFEGNDIKDVPPYKRQVNTVFQKHALFPHMTVYENIAFGPRAHKRPENEIKERVQAMLRMVNLEGFDNRPVASLSGGQQQRIAIVRALINEPKVLLLDEPLSALDLKLRKGMQTELKRIQKQLGLTFIYVTHDQGEALNMSDRIVVMNGGRIQQTGTPVDIYNEPKNPFVADFIGDSNILPGRMIRDNCCFFADREFNCVDKGIGCDVAVDVVIRPEDIKLTAPEKGMLVGMVGMVTFKGVHYEMTIRSEDGFEWTAQSTRMSPAGSRVGMCIGPDEIHVMPREDA